MNTIVPLVPDLLRNRMARHVYDYINGDRSLAEILLHAHASEYFVYKLLFELAGPTFDPDLVVVNLYLGNDGPDLFARPPSYRRPVTNWVTSAKQAATRELRLAALIEDSKAGRKIKQMRWSRTEG